jgi:hypothetical protein
LTAGWILFSRWNAGPAVDGLTLDQWLESSFDFEDGVYSGRITVEFNAALQKLGTNAIPHLLAKLQTREFPLTLRLRQWIGATRDQQTLAHKLRLNYSILQRQRAVHGFMALGSLATNAIPQILSMPPNYHTRGALAGIGPAGLPILRDAAAHGSDQIKSHAMSALESRQFDFKREEIVAIWIERLADPSPSIRLHAARLLGNTRPIRAQAAIEPLQKLANDPNPDVALAVKGALGNLNVGGP